MRHILLASPLLSILGASPALAQVTQPPAPPATQAPGADATQGDIIVTAQKRSESILKVPLSVTVVTAAALNDAGARNLSQLNGVVPGITLGGNASMGIAPISIRGTSGTAAFLEDDPVAVYVDGVYQSSGFFSSSALTDIAAVEVVRGPQGTLQGRNATAGAVLVRTADPTSELSGFIDGTVASYGYFRGQGAISGPLTKGLLARLSLDGYTNRGWARNIATGNHAGGGDGKTARLVLMTAPGGDFHARLALTYQDIQDKPALARYAVTTINPAPGQAVTAPTPGTALSAAALNTILNDHVINENIDTNNRNRSGNVVLELGYDFGGARLVSLSGYNSYKNAGLTDSDGLPFTDRQGYNRAELRGHGWSEELRLQSTGGGMFDWTIGGLASNTISTADISIYNLTFSVPRDQRLAPSARQSNPAYAVFGDVTLHFADHWALSGGLRYTSESKTFTLVRKLLSVPSDAALAPDLVYNPPKKTWTDLSYRTKLTFTPTTDVMLYGGYSKGFKSGGFNAFTNDAPFDPETLYSGEIGVKARLFDRHLTIAASAYTNQYKNLQVNSGVLTGGFVIKNAASARIRGFEIEGDLRVDEHFKLSGNIAYVDARYTSFVNAPNIFNAPVDASGNRLLRAPEWQYFAQAEYSHALSSDLTATGKLSYRWRDKIYFAATDQNLSTFGSAPLGELGARISLHYGPADLTATVYATNLADVRRVTNEAVTFSYPLASFNEPRTFGLEISKKF